MVHSFSEFTVEYMVAAGAIPRSAGRSPSSSGIEAVKFATPRAHDETLDANDTDGRPRRYCTLANMLTTTQLIPTATDSELAKLSFLSEEEPASFVEAEEQEWWRKAMVKEMNSIVENKTWWLTDLPIGHHPIASR
ncbi:hypothetical protein E2562_017328 [Oryza meyeriana var. granulata]|uniref:Uncharacterized protein n=1 Tax=Oryza meyeriana var. granulata TaxID=110450 RepID=A0A6G1BX74_9ORYZ|nr:hypothetical protein E2562_017328 [Oryza meyeriana var. granulata]